MDGSISELTGQLAGNHDVRASTRSASDIDANGHGTMVTSVIAARKNNVGIHGVAFEARVLAIRADTPGTCQTTGTDQGCKFSDSALIQAINYAVANGARIINMSLGGEIDNDPSLENAIRSAAAQGVLVVIAAGNEGKAPTSTAPAEGQSPTEPAYIAGQQDSLGRVVAVGAVDRSGQMPTFSNRAGQTANFYLLAPGVSIVAAGVDDNVRLPNNPTCTGGQTTNCNDTDDDGDYWLVSGTSFAAPAVAGALALLLDLFPNLTPEAALDILLVTADDYITSGPDPILGINATAGVDAVSGRGIMNLRRAFSPIGTASFNFGSDEVTMAETLAPARGALGDWAAHSGAFDGLVLQDRYRRGFRMGEARLAPSSAPFGDFALRADHARGTARAIGVGPAELSWFSLPRPVYDPRTPWQEAPDATFELSYAMGDSRISLGRGGAPQSLTPMLSLIDDPSGPAALGSGGSWTSFAQAFGPLTFDARASDGALLSSSSVGVGGQGEDWALRLGYAHLGDAGSALGGRLQSRFGGNDETQMTAFSLEARRDVGAWRLSGMVEAAEPRLRGLQVQDLWTSAWSLSAERPVGGGMLRLSAAQPRRSEGGVLSFAAPVEMTRSGRIIHETREARLVPSGRELDLEAALIMPLNHMARLEAAIAMALEPNHVADAEAEAAVWISFRSGW